jgi:predicted amidophosphoribosyltransferase
MVKVKRILRGYGGKAAIICLHCGELVKEEEKYIELITPYCGGCNKRIEDIGQNYCGHCGEKLDWY